MLSVGSKSTDVLLLALVVLLLVVLVVVCGYMMAQMRTGIQAEEQSNPRKRRRRRVRKRKIHADQELAAAPASRRRRRRRRRRRSRGRRAMQPAQARAASAGFKLIGLPADHYCSFCLGSYQIQLHKEGGRPTFRGGADGEAGGLGKWRLSPRCGRAASM